MAEYDAIVVRGGHHGLVASAYLARDCARAAIADKKRTGPIRDRVTDRFSDRFSDRPVWASRATQEMP